MHSLLQSKSCSLLLMVRNFLSGGQLLLVVVLMTMGHWGLVNNTQHWLGIGETDKRDIRPVPKMFGILAISFC